MVKKWEIYWVSLSPVVGSEQSGIRPALVVSNDIVNEVLPVVTIVPLSSHKPDNRIYPTEVFISKDLSHLPKDSVAMIHQIRTIAKVRIDKVCGCIEDEELRKQMKERLRRYFEL